MAAAFATPGVNCVFVYTREAHPGANYPHHSSFEHKLDHARAMGTRWHNQAPTL